MTAPLKVRLLSTFRRPPDWSALSGDALRDMADRANRSRSKPLMRLVLGRPDRDADIAWRNVALPDRVVGVRVLRPARATGPLPLVVHVHGGGFVGTAVQCDWLTSHIATALPAVVVSVEHRLLTEELPLTGVIDDGWDVLNHVVDDAPAWGVDPGAVAVVGESCGSMV
ncbi:MAG TPA: alpha/beta hydrolase fold domain-containing protein, partial [Phytomonospora sp.]